MGAVVGALGDSGACDGLGERIAGVSGRRRANAGRSEKREGGAVCGVRGVALSCLIECVGAGGSSVVEVGGPLCVGRRGK